MVLHGCLLLALAGYHRKLTSGHQEAPKIQQLSQKPHSFSHEEMALLEGG